MAGYEYKVIPAPAKGQKSKGVKGPEARFALALELAMNELARDGWEYQRSDILPSEERQGLTSSRTVYRSVLVFRRAGTADQAGVTPPPAIPVEMPEEAETEVADIPDTVNEDATETAPEDDHSTDIEKN